MHPVERLRTLARSGGLDHRTLVGESVPALAALSHDPGALVLSCRRLLRHHPSSGPLTWLCARVLAAEDRRAGAWRCAEEIDADPSADHLAAELPEAGTVVVLGWPEVAAEALARRADVASLVVGAGAEGALLASRLRAADVDATEVAPGGMAAALGAADVLVLEADALGTDGFVAVSGSYAAALVARHVGVPVWLAAGAGRALPPGLWSTMRRRLARDDPWAAGQEVVPIDLVDAVIRPDGRAPDGAAGSPDCPDAPELQS